MKIPKPEQIHPAIAEKQAKQVEIANKKRLLLAELADVRERIRRSPSSDNRTDSAEGKRIREILGEAPIGPESVSDRQRLSDLLIQLDALNKALDIVSAQTRHEREIASRLVCNEARPEAMKRAKAFAKAYLDLHAAHIEYERFLVEVENTGTNIASLNRVFPSYLGNPRDTCGGYHYSLRDFVDAGVIDRSDVPAEIR